MSKRPQYCGFVLSMPFDTMQSICVNQDTRCRYYVNQKLMPLAGYSPYSENLPDIDVRVIDVIELVEVLCGFYTRVVATAYENRGEIAANHDDDLSQTPMAYEKFCGIAFYLNSWNTFLMNHEPLTFSRDCPYDETAVDEDRYQMRSFTDYDPRGKKVMVRTYGMDGDSDFEDITAVNFEFCDDAENNRGLDKNEYAEKLHKQLEEGRKEFAAHNKKEVAK